MITFKNIGLEAARLGNQMSQYAAVLGLAYKNNYDFAIPYQNQHRSGTMFNLDPNVQSWIKVNFRVPEGFDLTAPDLTERDELLVVNNYEEPIGFDPTFFDLPDNTNIHGYFQCEKYWSHIEDVVRKEFTFKQQYREQAEEQIAKARNNQTPLVSIHIRRGDYVGNQNRHPLQTLEYYQAALNTFDDDDYTFLIFSDDLNWCRDYFGDSERIVYIDNNIDFVDMCMMSLCDHNIIANSTFSWWGAWLNANPNKKVVAPSNWLGPEIKHLQTDDLYCANWIII
jgi:hypothetical protein